MKAFFFQITLFLRSIFCLSKTVKILDFQPKEPQNKVKTHCWEIERKKIKLGS